MKDFVITYIAMLVYSYTMYKINLKYFYDEEKLKGMFFSVFIPFWNVLTSTVLMIVDLYGIVKKKISFKDIIKKFFWVKNK